MRRELVVVVRGTLGLQFACCRSKLKQVRVSNAVNRLPSTSTVNAARNLGTTLDWNVTNAVEPIVVL